MSVTFVIGASPLHMPRGVGPNFLARHGCGSPRACPGRTPTYSSPHADGRRSTHGSPRHPTAARRRRVRDLRRSRRRDPGSAFARTDLRPIGAPSSPRRRRIALLAGAASLLAAVAVIVLVLVIGSGRGFHYDDPLERMPAGGTAAGNVRDAAAGARRPPPLPGVVGGGG